MSWVWVYQPDAPDPNTLAAPESLPFEDDGGDMST